ncbi:MAG: PorV/PorQ family protein [Bacteroidetes bacterium]|nr:PorV/PorQ family protein [Bacteroidota bacterium]
MLKRLWGKTCLYSFLIVTGSFIHLSATAQFTKYSNEFLNIGAGARGMSMAGAQVASVSDGTAGYWNPAALANIRDNPQLNLMHAEYYAGVGKYDFANLTLPLKDNKRTIGLTLLRFAVDDIPNTIFLVQPDGTVNFDNITTFSSADYAFIFSLAQRADFGKDKHFNFGANAKIIRRTAGDFASAWGFGFDVAAQLSGNRWKIGALAKDVTTTFNAWSFSLNEQIRQVFYETQNEIPGKSTELTAPQLLLGGSYDFRLTKKLNLLVEADAYVTFDGRRNTVISTNPVSVEPRLGLELSFKDVFFVRGGVNNFQKVLDDRDTLNQKKIWIYQPSVGAGFKVGDVQIDYAFTNLANQSYPLYTHVFSVRVDLRKKEKKK